MDLPLPSNSEMDINHNNILRSGFCSNEITTTFTRPTNAKIIWIKNKVQHELGLCLGKVSFRGHGYYIMLRQDQGALSWKHEN